MTLGEAIKHCEEVVKQYESKKALTAVTLEACQCAGEHYQLAQWLKLLQRILDSGDCNNCAMLHSQCRYSPRWGEQVRYNCPFYSREEEPQDGFTKWAKSVADGYRNDKEESK